VRNPVLRACSQAGLVNNLNDALAWGLAPLYLAAHGANATRIGSVAAIYPGVWGFLQLGTGALSDRLGRKPLIVVGMFVQAAALALLVAGDGAFAVALVAAALLGSADRLEYSMVGDSVNLAQRIQGWAAAGEIVLSEPTYAALKSAVEAEELPRQQVKGRVSEVGGYRIAAVNAAPV
jgi:MFS family permease